MIGLDPQSAIAISDSIWRGLSLYSKEIVTKQAPIVPSYTQLALFL